LYATSIQYRPRLRRANSVNAFNACLNKHPFASMPAQPVCTTKILRHSRGVKWRSRGQDKRSSADPGVQPWPAGLWRPKGPAVAGSSDLGLAAVGERQWSWPEPGTAPVLCGTHLARSDAGLVGGHRGTVLGGSGWSGAYWEPDRAGWPVQRESTATGADLTGRARTSWDGDLHRRTAADVLPADGMQEARGSSPLSSTFPQVKCML
jgi:hypothetical protein